MQCIGVDVLSSTLMNMLTSNEQESLGRSLISFPYSADVIRRRHSMEAPRRSGMQPPTQISQASHTSRSATLRGDFAPIHSGA